MQNIYAVPWGTNHANIPAGLASDQLLSDTLPESIIGEYFKILAEQPGGEQPDLNRRSTGGEGIVGRESVFSRQVGDSDRSTDEDLAIKATSGNSKPTSPENGMSGQPMIERVAQSPTGGDNTLPHDLGHDENTRLSFHNGRFYYKGMISSKMILLCGTNSATLRRIISIAPKSPCPLRPVDVFVHPTLRPRTASLVRNRRYLATKSPGWTKWSESRSLHGPRDGGTTRLL